MFKSIFSRYFAITSVVLIISVVLLGCIQTVFFIRYWSDEKAEMLTDNARQIAAHTANSAIRGIGEEGNDVADNYYIIPSTLSPVISLVASGTDCNIFIADLRGKVIVNSGAPQSGGRVPEEVLATADQPRVFNGTMGDLFATPQYAAVEPISVGGQRIGYVIAAAPTDSMWAYIGDNMKAFLLSALGVLALAFVLIYVITSRMVRPLREMAAATRQFAQGDFSPRITLQGNDEITELAASLNNMAKSLSASEDMSRSFVANVSHELRTPMTTISGFIDGILDGTIPPEKQQHYLKIVSDEVRRLSRLIRAMLDLSRIDNRSLQLNPVQFDLTEVVCRTLLSFEQRVDDKEITIDGMEDCPRVMATADCDLIGQVVYNLIDNAVKFTNEGGTITVTLRQDDGRALLSVRNTGKGIAAEEMPRVFERFYKSDRSRGLDKTGLGLGLYIVKSVITLSGGQITVRSTEGEYCEFAFWLPYHEQPLPPIQPDMTS